MKSETRIATDWGWGFCSSECKQDLDQKEKGVLRSLDNADILSEEYCDRFLQNLLPAGGKFQFRPHLLCLGKNNSLRYQVFYTDDRKDPKAQWKQVESEFLKKNADLIPDIYHRNMVDIDRDKVYVSSIGSCKGDSGGPAFVKSKKET